MEIAEYKEFNLKYSIDYLEFWQPIDGKLKLMAIWAEMGDPRRLKIVAFMGYNLTRITEQTALNILKKAFSRSGIEKTRDLMLELFKKEIKCSDIK